MEPTDLTRGQIKVRVWADALSVEGDADRIVERLGEVPGWRLIERSAPRPARPPAGDTARVYLTFTPGNPRGDGPDDVRAGGRPC
jgi:hypothetical protein